MDKFKKKLKQLIAYVLIFITFFNTLSVFTTTIVKAENNNTQIEENLENENLEPEIPEEEIPEEEEDLEEEIIEENVNPDLEIEIPEKEKIDLKNLIQKSDTIEYISIFTVEDLKNIKNDLSANYILENDLYLNGEEWESTTEIEKWEPIGNLKNPFIGKFDGNGFIINNLVIRDNSNDYVGFFGYIKNAEIKGLTIRHVTIVGTRYAGGIAGYSVNSKITRCAVIGRGMISNSSYIGGILGYSKGNTFISECYTNIDMLTTGLVGGIQGNFTSSDLITNSYSKSMITPFFSYDSGGIAAKTNEIFTIGDGFINNSYYVGIIPQNVSPIYKSSYNSDVVGRYSFYNKDLAPNGSPEHYGRTTEELMRKSTYYSWNFNNIWGIDENKSYPYLLKNNEKQIDGPITKVILPGDSKIYRDNSIRTKIIEGTGKIDLEIEIEDGFTWKIFDDKDLGNEMFENEYLKSEISSNDINIEYGENIFYIETTNGKQKDIYKLIIMRIIEKINPIENLRSINLNNRINLTWNLLDNQFITGYKVFRSISEDSGFTEVGHIKGKGYIYYNDRNIEPNITYYYKVIAFNEINKFGVLEEAMVVSGQLNDTENPKAKAGFNFNGLANTEVNFDGGSSSDNVSIKSYSWDLGDGTTSTEKKLTHTYTKEGIYKVTLTVTDTSNNISSDTITVTIRPEDQTGKLVLKLVDEETNKPLINGMIYLDYPEEPLHFVTNNNGEVEIYIEPGNYNIAGYTKGYMPKQENIEVAQYETRNYTLKLKKEEVVIGDIVSRPLDIDEIIEAGIDPNDPDNNYVYEFEITLVFEGKEHKEKIITNGVGKNPKPDEEEYKPIIVPGGGGIGSGSGKGKENSYTPKPIPIPDHPEIPPTIAILRTPSNSMKFLKEFFSIALIVQNNAPEDFIITDNIAKLNLPEGLSLAKTSEGQSLEVDLNDIPGGGNYTAYYEWIIRGDTEGEYNIDVDYSGILMPFKAKLEAIFKTSEPIIVSGGKNLVLLLNPDTIGKEGEVYNIDYEFINFSDKPLYNLELKLGDGKNRNLNQETTIIYTDPETGEIFEYLPDPSVSNKFKIDSLEDASKISTLDDGDSIIISVLYPGESLKGIYSTTFKSDSKKEIEFYLKEAFTNNTGGNIDIDVIFGSMGNGYTVKNPSTPITSNNQNGSDPLGYMHNTVSITNFNNDKLINFQYKYSSGYNKPNLKDVQKEEEKKETSGWSTNFDLSIRKMDDGSLGVYYSDTEYVKFRSNDTNNRIIHGDLEKKPTENLITVGKSTDIGEYKSNQVGFRRYILTKNSGGTYSLVDDEKNNYYFDEDGKLSKTIDREGKTLTINETTEKKEVTEESTGQKITSYYDEHGNISKISDEFGNEATFNYNSDGMLSKITDIEGKITEYEYDANNRLSKIKDRQGEVISYEYDKYGRTIKETDGLGNFSSYEYNDSEDFWSTTITKTDRNNNTTKTKVDKAGQVVSKEDSLGNKTLYTYNEFGDLTSEIDPDKNTMIYSYNEFGDIIKITDREGVEQLMTYDEDGNLLSSELRNGSKNEYKYNENNWLIESKNERGVIGTFSYNENGQVIEKNVTDLGTANYIYENGKLISQKDFQDGEIKYKYNELGFVTEITNQEGNKYSYTVDKKGRVLESTAPNGLKIINTYDERGNLLSTNEDGNLTTYEYDLNNRLLSIKNPLDEISTFNYDLEGNLISGTNPDQGIFEYFYNSNNNLIKQKNPNGGENIFEYNNKNKIIKNILPNTGEIIYDYYKNGLLKSETDPNNNVTKYFYNEVNNLSRIENANNESRYFEYDSSGNLIKTIDSLGNETQMEYDEFSRIIKEINPLGDFLSYKYNSNHELIEGTDYLGNISKRSYKKNGLIETETNPLGGITKFDYNNMNQIISVINPLGHKVQGTYDKFGNLISLIDALENTVETIKYDKLNRPIESMDALGNVKTVEYNEVSEVIKKTNELNHETTFSYDKLGNILKSLDPEGGEINFQYDLMNNMTLFQDGNGNQTEIEYDLAGLVLKEKMSIGSEKNYKYNSLNLLSEVTNGRNQNIIYTYDSGNRLTNLSEIGITYDKLGNILTVENEEGITTKTYDKNSQLVNFTNTNGDNIKYSYDELGNIIEIIYPSGDKIKYEYNILSQLKKVTDYKNRTTEYFYNPNGQLIQTVNSNGTIENLEYNILNQVTKKEIITTNYRFSTDYSYDKTGNLLSEEKPDLEIENPIIESFLINKEMKYTNGNRLLTYNDENVFYDLDGNMTHGPLKGEMVDFKYDKFNQLVEGNGSKYFYDGEGNRTKQTWNNGNYYLEYVTNPLGLGSVISSKKETGEITQYVYGLGLISQEKINKESSGIIYSDYKVFIFDSRGSTIALTNENGSITDTFLYGPFGELEERTGTSETIFLYVGKYGVQKDQNGLSYMRARYYNPDTQSFINIDPIKDGLNWYGYVGGNPIMYIDPSGEMAMGQDAMSDGGGGNSKRVYNRKLKNGEIIITREEFIQDGFISKYPSSKYITYSEVLEMNKIFIRNQKMSENINGARSYSDKLVDFVKEGEGFRATAYNNGKTIGYGFDFYLYPDIKINYNSNGEISEAEGERLLRLFLDKSQNQINAYLDANNLTLDQNAYDAITDLYYNRNSNPLTQEIVFAMANRDDDKVKKLFNDFDFRYAMEGYVWGIEKGDIRESQAYVDRNPGLKNRRNEEYNIYKNGL